MKSQKDAEALCQSLETWAKDYYLNENWFLDFALGILRAFKSSFDFVSLNFNEADLSLNEARTRRAIFELEVIDSIPKAISDYRDKEVLMNKWLELNDLEELPAFEYRWRDFELSPLTWLPRMSSQKGFVKEMHDKLQKTTNHLHNSKNSWNYSNNDELNRLLERCRNRLEGYCDHIEKQKSENISEAVFPPVNFDDLGKALWFPSKQNRERFVEETIVKLKVRIININKAVNSLETFTKRDFQTKLTEYCNEIEKSLPKNSKRTPQKYSENKHWLSYSGSIGSKKPSNVHRPNRAASITNIRNGNIGNRSYIKRVGEKVIGFRRMFTNKQLLNTPCRWQIALIEFICGRFGSFEICGDTHP